jgi:hypothetical protein
MGDDMATDVEIERALAALTATLNDQQLDHLDRDRAQAAISQEGFTLDEGGGVHDETGARVGALRQTSSGEWIAERQNDAAEHSDTAVPSAPEPSGLGKLFGKLKGQ